MHMVIVLTDAIGSSYKTSSPQSDSKHL